MTGRGRERRAAAGMVGALLIMGTIGLFRRLIPMPSAPLAFSRGVLGSLSLLLLSLLTGRRAGQRPSGRTLALLLISGAAIGVNWILLFEAYSHTTVATATLCYYAQPTIVLLLSPLLFRERLTAGKLACAGAAVIGMVLVSGVLEPGGTGPGQTRGVLLGLAAAVFYAGAVILNKLTPGVDPFRKTILQLAAAAAALIPYLLVTGGFADPGMSGTEWLLVLVVGVVHTGLAYALYFGSMDGLPSQTVALLSYLDPVVALILSWVALAEPVTRAGLAGAVLILGAAAVGERLN